MKLEIGGQRKIEGWTNMGQRDNNFNIITQELPFEDESLSEVYWSHVIEHISPAYIKDVVTKIYNKLEPNGKFRTVCPDLRAIVDAYVNNDLGAFDRKSGRNHWSSYKGIYSELGIGGAFVAQICNTSKVEGDENILISGDKQYMYGTVSHVAGYDYDMLERLFKMVGFSEVERTELEPLDPHRAGGQLCVNAYK